ncbi:MAG: hypothetical protein QOF48_111 [Verrucomicrobiota bacterium]|jgi:hypothetical protein
MALALMALLLASHGVRAQLPIARLSNLFPPGGRSGSRLEVRAAGNDLDDPLRLYFSHPGISGRVDDGKFIVTIASNVPPGIYDARFVGRFGVSNPRAFVVGTLPESLPASTNLSPATSLELPLDATFNCRIPPNAAAWFKFTARKNRRLFVECLSEGIDSRMNAMLVLTDTHGRELERSRTSGLIDFTPREDGEYRLRVADFLYRGGDDYFYRITLSSGPRLDFILPSAGVPGTTTNFTIYGRNLPGGQPVSGQSLDGKPFEQLTVTIEVPRGSRATRLDTGLPLEPSAAGIDGFEYRLATPRGNSNPLFVGFATAPVIVPEYEPNNTAGHARKIHPPCEVTGQFYPAGNIDVFVFDARKADVFWIEVFSQRTGLPTDPMLVIQRVTRNDKGEEIVSDISEVYDNDTNIGEREFNTSSRDPLTRFEAPEEGTYRIFLKDAFGGTQASPRHVYRLAVRRPAPDFRLVAMAVAPKFKADAKDIAVGVPLLRRGETILLRVMAFRRDGFNGDIQLSIENGPPGLVFAGDNIEAGKSTDYILLSATEEAPAFAGPVRLVGRARIGTNEIVREARGATMRYPVGSTDNERPKSRVASEFALAICDREKAPLTIAAGKSGWEAVEKTRLEIPMQVTRRNDFNAAFKLKPIGPGAPESLKEIDVAAKGTNAVLKLDLAALKLGPGTYVFAAQGIAAGKYRNNPEAAAATEAASKEADDRFNEATAAAKKATDLFEAAAKALSASHVAAKNAKTEFDAAKAASNAMPEDEKRKAALPDMEKTAVDAAAKGRMAEEAQAAAQQAKSSAEALLNSAKARKESAATLARDAKARAEPRDVSYQVTTAPVVVKVLPAPPGATHVAAGTNGTNQVQIK